MNTIIEHLQSHKGDFEYKINQNRTESYELFFVKGALETVRNTDNTDREVTVYVTHGAYKGHASFFVYPSTTGEELDRLIEEAIEKAKLIENPDYRLPGAEIGEPRPARAGPPARPGSPGTARSPSRRCPWFAG